MTNITLNSNKIFELGDYISKFLAENKVKTENNLVIRVSKEELTKIDEDLYYRNKPKGEDFIPSDEDLIVKFENLNIVFTSEEEKPED